MKVLFFGNQVNRIDRLVLALRLRWSELVPVVVSRAADLVQTLEDEQPQLVVVCDSPKETDLNEIIRAVRAITDAPLMVVSDSEGDDSTRAIRALEEGADDYIRPTAELMEIMARAVALHRRAHIREAKDETDGPVVCGRLRIIPNTYEAFVGSDQLDLTPTEFRLLYLLAQNSGMIMTRETIRRVLWINDYYCSDALKKYVQRLRRKLGDDAKNPRWIRTVHGVGYMMSAA